MQHPQHMHPDTHRVRPASATGLQRGPVHARALLRGAVMTLACVAALCAGVVNCPSAQADSSARLWVQSSQLSLDEAAERVQSAFGGRVVAAQPARASGREGFRIRVLLDDGRVITVFVDADSGAMRPMG